jgi:HK97 family phage portal protein
LYNPFKRKQPKALPAPALVNKQITAAHIIGLEPWNFANGLSAGGSDSERYENAKTEWRGLVFACEDVRATTLALTKLELYDASEEAVEEHPLYDLMRRPNSYQSEFELRYNTQMMLDQFGNAFWYVERQGGAPVALYQVKPEYMKAVFNPTRPGIEAWENNAPGLAPRRYRADEIIHFKRPNPYNSIYGASVIMRAAMEIDQDILMKMASLGLLQNKSVPPIVIKATAESGIGQDAMERLLDMWNAKYRGPSNAGFAAGVPAGVEVQALTGIDIKQLLYLEAREFGRKEICAIFRTPEAMLGYVADANRANMATLEYIFKTQTIKPLGRMFCDTIEARLLPMFKGSDNLSAELDYEIPRDDIQHLAEITAGFERSWFNADECRAELGYMPKGDETGEQYFISAALIRIEDAINPPEPEPILMPAPEDATPPDATPPENTKPNEQPEEDVDANDAAAKSIEVARSADDIEAKYHSRSLFKTVVARSARAVATDQLRSAWTEAYHAKLEKFLRGQKKRVLAAMRDSYKAIAKDASDYQRWLDDAFNDEDAEYEAAMKGITERLVIAFGTSAVHDLNPAASYRLGKMREIIANDIHTRSHLINETTGKQLRELIQTAIDEGDINATGLGRRIAEYFNDISVARANTIARTEVGRAQTMAKHDGWEQMGAAAREWITFPGNRGETDDEPVHLEADGAIARMGEPYDLAGMAIMGPRESGLPDVDCNCRCDESPITDEDYQPPTLEEAGI